MPKLPPALVSALRIALTLTVVLIGLYAGQRIWLHYQVEPWTRDGRVRADVMEIAPDVPGLVTQVAVSHDQSVKAGQLLFTIDRERYDLALKQADAAIVTAQATIKVQKAAIGVAKAAIVSHRAALAEAQREAARNDGLASLVSREVTEQSHTKVAEEQAAVSQGEAAVLQAEAAETQAESAVAQAQTARGLAQLNLDRTEVHAPANGLLSDVNVRVGDYVSPGKPVMAMVDAASLRVEGYFEETKIPRLRVGQAVEVRLMGEENALRGHIVSIAPAIEDRERGPSASMLPNVNPTFSWVRLAQRIPVRIALDKIPDGLRLIVGRTASVTALEGGEPAK
jgi:multidrug resistance efflux pump